MVLVAVAMVLAVYMGQLFLGGLQIIGEVLVAAMLCVLDAKCSEEDAGVHS